MEHHCRIRRFRLKTGAEVTMLRRPGVGNGVLADFREVTAEAAHCVPDMTGYAVVVLTDRGNTHRTYARTEDFPMRCMPEVARSLIEREINKAVHQSTPPESA